MLEWAAMAFLLQVIFPTQGLNLASPLSPGLTGEFLTTSATGEVQVTSWEKKVIETLSENENEEDNWFSWDLLCMRH